MIKGDRERMGKRRREGEKEKGGEGKEGKVVHTRAVFRSLVTKETIYY